MNRRQFFKTVAATAAGVVVAPAVVKAKEPLMFLANPAQRCWIGGTAPSKMLHINQPKIEWFNWPDMKPL